MFHAGIGCCQMRGLQEDLVQLHIVGVETEETTRMIAGVEDMRGEARAIDWESDLISISTSVHSALLFVCTDFTVLQSTFLGLHAHVHIVVVCACKSPDSITMNTARKNSSLIFSITGIVKE